MNTVKYTGAVKWFNLVKGFGFITRDDGQDVFVHQSAIKAQSFRSLEEGEKVEFGVIESDKGKIAIQVSGIGGGNVKGASRKSRKKKGARKLTNLCFNCNEPGHVLKDCTADRVDSRTCHQCGSDNHLIRKCPLLSEEQRKLITEKKTGSVQNSSVEYSLNETQKDLNDNSVQIMGKHSIMFDKINSSSSSEEGEECVDDKDGCSQVKRQRLEQNGGVESYSKTFNGHIVYNSVWATNHELQPISSCS